MFDLKNFKRFYCMVYRIYINTHAAVWEKLKQITLSKNANILIDFSQAHDK